MQFADHNMIHTRTFRLLDLHATSSATRDAIFAERIERLLRVIFQRDPLAFQTLQFRYGSQQGMHRDPAYVVVSSPTELVASWIALEDIVEGSGELTYFRKSHRLSELEDIQNHHGHLKLQSYIGPRMKNLKLEQSAFIAKKGDVLLWHADLVHGGGAVTDTSLTRKSLVTHYCPRNIKPNYFRRFWINHIREHKPHCFYSSNYYNIASASVSETAHL